MRKDEHRLLREENEKAARIFKGSSYNLMAKGSMRLVEGFMDGIITHGMPRIGFPVIRSRRPTTIKSLFRTAVAT